MERLLYVTKQTRMKQKNLMYFLLNKFIKSNFIDDIRSAMHRPTIGRPYCGRNVAFEILYPQRIPYTMK